MTRATTGPGDPDGPEEDKVGPGDPVPPLVGATKLAGESAKALEADINQLAPHAGIEFEADLAAWVHKWVVRDHTLLEGARGDRDDDTLYRFLRGFAPQYLRRLIDERSAQDPKSARIVDWYRKGFDVAQPVPWRHPSFPGVEWKGDLERTVRESLDRMRFRGDRDEWAASLLEVAAAIMRAEDETDVTRERITDVLAHAESRVVAAGTSDDALARFVRMQYRMLDGDPGQRGRPSLGIVQSLSATAEVTGRSKSRALLEASIELYMHTIRLLAKHYIRGSDDVGGAWERVKVMANNITGHLSMLGGFDGGVRQWADDNEVQLARLMNRFHVLNVIAEALSAAVGGADDVERRRRRWRDFGFDLDRIADALVACADADRGVAGAGAEAPETPETPKPSPGEVAAQADAIVRTMNNVISAWAHIDAQVLPRTRALRAYWGEDVRLIVTLFGAILRADFASSLARDRGDAASSFFNSGLAINRLSKRTKHHRRSMEWLEVVCYGLGLLWSLAAAQGVLRRALGDFYGGSCTVNLAGALVRAPSGAHSREPLSALAREMFAAERLGIFADIEAQRFRSSMVDLLGRDDAARIEREASGREPDAGGVIAAVHAIMALAHAHAQAPRSETAGIATPAGRAAPAAVVTTELGSFADMALPWVRFAIERSFALLADDGAAVVTPQQFVEILTTAIGELLAYAADPVRLADLSDEMNLGVEQLADFDASASAQAPLPRSYREWFSQPGVFRWLKTVQLRPVAEG